MVNATFRTLARARGRRRSAVVRAVTLRKLRDFRALGRRISRIEERLEELEAPLYDPRTPRLSGMPRSPSTRAGSAQERLADATIDLRATYLHQLARLREEAGRIETALDALQPQILADVLRLRYIDGLTIAETAEAMSYSTRNIDLLQRRALARLARE